MTRHWTFTDLEFVVCWETTKEGPLPPPLVFTSRTRLLDDYNREKAQVRERLRATLNGSFDGVLETMARPDVRIVVRGRDPRDPHDPEGCVRVLGIRRGDVGYVVKELAGETIWHSGGFTVTECEPLSLADAVVACIPDVGAGILASVELLTAATDDGLDYLHGRSEVVESINESDQERSWRFLSAPSARIGTIDVVQGMSRFGPRGITGHRLWWRDVEGDGRYMITGRRPPVAEAVDATRLTAMINAQIAKVIRAIKDECA